MPDDAADFEATKNARPLRDRAFRFYLSGRQDSNLRSPGPKPGAVTGLGHAPSAVSGGKDS